MGNSQKVVATDAKTQKTSGKCELPSFFIFSFFGEGASLCHPGWSEMARPWLTTTSASWVQVILLSQALQ